MMQGPGGIPVSTPCLFRHFADGTCGIRTHKSFSSGEFKSPTFASFANVPWQKSLVLRDFIGILLVPSRTALILHPYGNCEDVPGFYTLIPDVHLWRLRKKPFDVRLSVMSHCHFLRFSPAKYAPKESNFMYTLIRRALKTVEDEACFDAEAVGLPALQPCIMTEYALLPPAYQCRIPVRNCTGICEFIPSAALSIKLRKHIWSHLLDCGIPHFLSHYFNRGRQNCLWTVCDSNAGGRI